MRPEFKVRTYADYLLIREGVEEDKLNYELKEQSEQRHLGTPELRFSEGNFGYAPEGVVKGRRVPIVAEMQFNYETPFHMQRRSHFGKVVFAFLMVLVFGLAVNLWAGYQDAQIVRARATCRVYTEYGVPTFMTIDESRYDLKSNGDVVGEQAPFVNPFHAEIVETKKGCQTIRIK